MTANTPKEKQQPMEKSCPPKLNLKADQASGFNFQSTGTIERGVKLYHGDVINKIQRVENPIITQFLIREIESIG